MDSVSPRTLRADDIVEIADSIGLRGPMYVRLHSQDEAGWYGEIVGVELREDTGDCVGPDGRYRYRYAGGTKRGAHVDVNEIVDVLRWSTWDCAYVSEIPSTYWLAAATQYEQARACV